MVRQIRLEVFKLVRRGRSYLGFGALLLISGLAVVALLFGPHMIETSMSQGFITAGSYLNGGFVAWTMLNAPPTALFLPLFACVVTGDMVSGETADGTLRTVLSRPVGRGSLFAAKFAVSVIYVVALTLFLGIAAYGIGTIFLGRGVLVTFQEGSMLGAQGIYVYDAREGLTRLAAAYAFVSVGVLSVATIALFLSTIVANSLGAIGGAMLTLIVFGILAMFDFFKPIHPFLFTTHLDRWRDFFTTPIPWGEIRTSLAVLFAYIVVFLLAGLTVFTRKDVIS